MKNKRNRVNVTIDGTDYSKYLCLPFVLQDTGTEQLDSAIIELRGMHTETKFRPFLAVSLCDGKYNYVVADDTVTEVYGRGLYNHEITLIDATKMTERILMEAKNFTQPLFRSIGKPQPTEIYYYKETLDGILGEKTETALDTENYKSPITVPIDDMHGYYLELFSVDKVAALFGFPTAKEQTWKLSVYYNSSAPAISPIVDKTFFEEIYSTGEIQDTSVSLGSFEADRGSGIYTVRYYSFVTVAGVEVFERIFIVPISVYDKNEGGSFPTPYSVVDVLEILLDTAKPIFTNEEAEYKLDLTTEQLNRWSSMESPEFHFANGRSLYENLKEVGDYLHALPKAKIVGGQKQIYFQELGKREPASINGVPYGNKQQFSASDYANAVEANFENLINAEDENDGSVTEPFQGGYITLRSDGYRIKEEDSYIPTAFPIGSKVTKVTVSGVVGIKHWYEKLLDGEWELTSKEEHVIEGEVDITPAIYEENEYNLLSSFSGSFPNAKTCALYYKTGERNIQGLWYRVEDKALSILNNFQKYSITNVINHFLGENYAEYDYKKLKFQVTYVPFINGRARQERTEFLGGDRMVLAHNQSANQLSASAFGESLRGKVAMLANPSESRQYLFASLDDVPKAGDMVGDKNFISLVTTRVFPDFCVSQIDLTENYNNVGAYAQLKTGIRQYEIPEGETRCTLIEEFCEIGKQMSGDEAGLNIRTLCQDKMKKATIAAFDPSTEEDDICISDITTFNYKDKTSEVVSKKTIAKNIALPVYSAALGNSVYFGFKFEDNYKAGASSIDIGLDDARGTRYVEYASAQHAKADLIEFHLYGKLDEKTQIPQDMPYTLPNSDIKMFNFTSPYIQTWYSLKWNKDTADSASIAYQLHFCSNDGYIITSELAKMMPYVRTSSKASRQFKAYFYDGEIDEVTGKPNGKELLFVGAVSVDTQNLCLSITTPTTPYKSFIIARNDRKCIIGKNTDKAPEKIYFNFKRKRG